MITIIDYEMGNLGSIANMCKYLDIDCKIENDPKKIKQAKKLLLPGVGSFDSAMLKIKEKGIADVLYEKASIDYAPILGICLGMQILTNNSEEGNQQGLGLIPATVHSFPKDMDTELKVPHMGWNVVEKTNRTQLSDVFDENEEISFYFVHSYYVKVLDESHSMFKTHYGFDFNSGICNNNIFGVQFHPEKSHRFGMRLLEGFARL